jgi:hypothetical protein
MGASSRRALEEQQKDDAIRDNATEVRRRLDDYEDLEKAVERFLEEYQGPGARDLRYCLERIRGW